MINKWLFTSYTDNRSTPDDFYKTIDNIYHFTLDPCASPDNAKCWKYFTIDDDWLSKSWANEVVFMNPPYWKTIKYWVQKAFNEWKNNWIVVVCLLPARTDTSRFHEYIYNIADIQFIKGRLKFWGSKNSAPFPSMLCVFK